MVQKKKQMEALQSFMNSLQEQPNEPNKTENLETPDKPILTDEAVQDGAMEAELVTPSGHMAPALSPEEVEELTKRQTEARNKKRGRPLKWSKTDANGHTIREDGYRRTSMIVNVELAAKMKEIAFREAMTEKEVLEQAMRLAVESYEKKYGVLVPTDRNRELFT